MALFPLCKRSGWWGAADNSNRPRAHCGGEYSVGKTCLMLSSRLAGEGSRRVGESDWDLYLKEAEYGVRKYEVCMDRRGGGGFSWEKRMKLSRNVRMVSSVRVIGTYLLEGKEVTKKETNLTSNVRLVSIVRVIWT